MAAMTCPLPTCCRAQALHAVRGRFPCLLSQLPGIFALDAAQNALHKTQGSLKRFWSSKVGSQTSVQLEQGFTQMDHVGKGRQCWRRCVILRWLHVLFSFMQHSVSYLTSTECHMSLKSA